MNTSSMRGVAKMDDQLPQPGTRDEMSDEHPRRPTFAHVGRNPIRSSLLLLL